ncbi:hypothetical protein KCU75_g53, partial [Aureobasidium melanogenum]
MTEKPNNFVMMRWLQWKRTFRFFYFSGKTSFRGGGEECWNPVLPSSFTLTPHINAYDNSCDLDRGDTIATVAVGVRTAQASSARRFWY